MAKMVMQDDDDDGQGSGPDIGHGPS
jgi:hypothetical protein